MTGSDLYDMTSKLLLGYRMDNTLFYQLLNLVQWNREKQRMWVILRSEDSSKTINPVSNTIANSLYLTPFSLPSDFLNFYSQGRSIVLVSGNGMTFRWYQQITPERKHEYKDDDTKFYIDLGGNNFYLCGIVDQQYAAHLFYIKSSPAITASISWVFPSAVHPILAFDVAKMYKEMFDYDIVNAEQGAQIAAGAQAIYTQMSEWDDSLQKQALEGVDYPMDNQRSPFRSQIVGDNDLYS